MLRFRLYVRAYVCLFLPCVRVRLSVRACVCFSRVYTSFPGEAASRRYPVYPRPSGCQMSPINQPTYPAYHLHYRGKRVVYQGGQRRACWPVATRSMEARTFINRGRQERETAPIYAPLTHWLPGIEGGGGRGTRY